MEVDREYAYEQAEGVPEGDEEYSKSENDDVPSIPCPPGIYADGICLFQSPRVESLQVRPRR